MGRFFDALFVRGGWVESEDVAVGPEGEPWLAVHVHDSDLAILTFSPTPADTSSTAYLGYTVRTYFEDDVAPPTDPDADAAGLTMWLLATWPPSRDVADLGTMLRSRVVGDDDRPSGDQSPLVEEELVGLLNSVRLPLPEGLLEG